MLHVRLEAKRALRKNLGKGGLCQAAIILEKAVSGSSSLQKGALLLSAEHCSGAPGSGQGEWAAGGKS